MKSSASQHRWSLFFKEWKRLLTFDEQQKRSSYDDWVRKAQHEGSFHFMSAQNYGFQNGEQCSASIIILTLFCKCLTFFSSSSSWAFFLSRDIWAASRFFSFLQNERFTNLEPWLIFVLTDGVLTFVVLFLRKRDDPETFFDLSSALRIPFLRSRYLYVR